MVSKEQKRVIEVSRKYGLLPGTLKCRSFVLFEEGFSPKEARYILSGLMGSQTPGTFASTIRRYYDLWKRRESP